MKPYSLTQIIGGKRYSTATAQLLCGNDWWDGHNYERGGTQKFLYRTAKGAYFTLNLTQWTGSANHIEVVGPDEAQTFFELCDGMNCARVTFEQAFPGVKVEEA